MVVAMREEIEDDNKLAGGTAGRWPQSWVGWATTVLGVLSLLLVAANSALVLVDQSNQAEVNARQQFINQSIQLSRVNAGLVRALASAAVTNKDEKLRDLLGEQGINLADTAAPAQPAAGGANQSTRKN
jgi:hypothetical protein